jgi:hypothetical protein
MGAQDLQPGGGLSAEERVSGLGGLGGGLASVNKGGEWSFPSRVVFVVPFFGEDGIESW